MSNFLYSNSPEQKEPRKALRQSGQAFRHNSNSLIKLLGRVVRF